MLKASTASSRAAIVGIGNTRYGEDYRRRDVRRDANGLAAEAFKNALADCGLTAADIDGLGVPRSPGSPVLDQSLLDALGVRPDWIDPGIGSIESAIEALAAGKCKTMALVYASEQRSASYGYGGPQSASRMFPSYYYYHPWGFSSQGAHWALMAKRHQLQYGSTEAQLGAVAVALRKHALLNDEAVMHKPMSIDDYMAAPYVCRPLRLFDYCMVNDGGVALILRRVEASSGLRQPAVTVAGLASYHCTTDVAQLRPLVMDFQHAAINAVTEACLGLAKLSRREVRHFQVYDAFSINLPIALEGAGFCKHGEGLAFIQDGRIELGGELPCNTSGGMLSEAYMHGWNHAVEAVRQLRGAAGRRQVAGLHASLYCGLTSGSATAILFSAQS